MWYGLIDSNKNKAELGMILRVENKSTNKIRYYLYDEVNNRHYLFKYNKSGKINYDSFENIKVDEGVTLINDECRKWTVLGRKEEVYTKIFKRG